MTLDEAQIQFLETLYEATRLERLAWSSVEDDGRDAFVATVDGEAVEVELLYVPVTPGKGSERAFVRVSGLKTWFTCAVGTRGYDLVMSMLSLQVFGWSGGTAGSLKQLARATERVRALFEP
jgi:hypothetical protein